MSQSNDPWDSISSRPQRPAPAPPSPTPAKPKQGPGLAPLYDPPGWRGDLIRQLALAGLVVSIVTALALLCCPVLPILGLALSAPALFMAQKDLKQFAGEVHPDLIDHLTNSRSMAMGGAIVSGVATLVGLIGLGIYFAFLFLQIAVEASR